ncbi:MAG TPA: HAMP domain-containing sensor histidine kinase [Flavipsychrobacter sp.]
MRFSTTIQILLLAYIVAAYVFWGFSLQKQSVQISEQELLTLRSQVDSNAQPLMFASRLHEIEDKKNRRTKQYIGEGSTFLIVIFIGAAVVYSSFRRSIRLSRQQNNFMLSVTHELKSPIAAMKLNLQTLERHQLDLDKRNMLIERCVKEANRLNDLCNNMLLASQIEGKQYVPAKEALNLAEIVEESIHEYEGRYPNRFEMEEMVDTEIVGDKLMLQMALSNLVENALKYTPTTKPVRITVKKKNNCAILQVADEGEGIPDSEKSKIFNKFYRIGNEETRRTKGTGLGLYLTSKIARQHKGKITVKDNDPVGSLFEITIPLAKG